MRQMKRFLCVSSLSPHTMISVLHLVVLSSGPNRALITLSRALPCFCLRVEFLSSVLTSAPLPLFIFRTLQKVSPSPGHFRGVSTLAFCHAMFIWQHIAHKIRSASWRRWKGKEIKRKLVQLLNEITGISGSCDVVTFLFNLICSPSRITAPGVWHDAS